MILSQGLQSIPANEDDDNNKRLEKPQDGTSSLFDDNSSKFSELTTEEELPGRVFLSDDSIIKGFTGGSSNNMPPRWNVSDITLNDSSSIQAIRRNLDDDDDDDTRITGGGDNSSTAAIAGRRSRTSFATCRIPGVLSSSTTIETAKRRVNSLTGITMNQLKFDTLGLKGRDSEVHQLNQALDSICPPPSQEEEEEEEEEDSCIEAVESTRKTATTTTKKQFVTISGVSGTGKTVLATSIVPKVNKIGGLVAEGKFDLQLRSVPYSGIVEVGNAICGQIYARANKDGKSSKFAHTQKQLVKELGTDLKVLSRLIPALTEIVETEEPTKEQVNGGSSSNNNNDMNKKDANNSTKKKESSLDISDRFQQVCRRSFPTSPTVKEQGHDHHQKQPAEEGEVYESKRRPKSMNSFSIRSRGSVNSLGGRRMKLEDRKFSIFGRKLNFRDNKCRSPALIPFEDKLMEGEEDLTIYEDVAAGDDKDLHHNSMRMRHRFQDAFRRFLRIVTKYFPPLLVILDNLQWSDLSSLDLLEVILTDPRNSNLLVIGIYRSDEVDQHHSLARVLRELKDRSSKGTDDKEFIVQKIEMDSLSLEAVNQVIQHVLDEPNEAKTKGLAELCYKRTDGNAFFLRQFLNMLKDERLLNFSFGLISWNWDLEEIELQTKASENVVGMLTTRMRDLSPESQNILQLASCLGTTFQGRILRIVWKAYCENYSTVFDPSDSQETGLQDILNSLVQSGYLEENKGSMKRGRSCFKQQQTEYSFVHDKVHEAVYSLVSDKERAILHRVVGEILVSRLDHDDLEDAIFVAVHLLNQGSYSFLSPSIRAHVSLSRDEERINLAYLNCRAGQKAVSFSAFEAAADFASKGIALLPTNETAKWEGHRNLTLKLYAIGTKAEAFMGNADQVDRYSKEVISQKRLSMIEKLDVYTLWIDNLAYRGDLRDASKIGLEVLAKMGCKFPKSGNKFGLLLNLSLGVIGLKGLIKHNELEQFQSMPIDHDPMRRKMIVILNVLATVLYQRAKKHLVALITIRNIQYTLQYGLNDHSSVALAQIGFLFTGVLGELEDGVKFADAGVSLCSRLENSRARTLWCAHSIGHWTVPIRDNMKHLLEAYELGIQTGDTEASGWAMIAFIQQRFITSFSLELAVADLSAYTTQMKDFKRLICYEYGMFYWEVFDNLLGRTGGDFYTLGGTRMSKEDIVRLSAGKTRGRFRSNCNIFQGFLFCIYGKYEACANISVQYGHDEYLKTNPGLAGAYIEVLTKGLSCYAAARRTGKRKYRRHAQAIHSRVKKWMSKGCPNVQHYDLLLDAEREALPGGCRETAVKTYQKAIIMSARGGFLLEAGLATERLAALALEDNQAEEAKFRLEEACRYYTTFGAHRKVWLLKDQHTDMLQPRPTEISVEEARKA